MIKHTVVDSFPPEECRLAAESMQITTVPQLDLLDEKNRSVGLNRITVNSSQSRRHAPEMIYILTPAKQ